MKLKLFTEIALLMKLVNGTDLRFRNGCKVFYRRKEGELWKKAVVAGFCDMPRQKDLFWYNLQEEGGEEEIFDGVLPDEIYYRNESKRKSRAGSAPAPAPESTAPRVSPPTTANSSISSAPTSTAYSNNSSTAALSLSKDSSVTAVSSPPSQRKLNESDKNDDENTVPKPKKQRRSIKGTNKESLKTDRKQEERNRKSNLSYSVISKSKPNMKSKRSKKSKVRSMLKQKEKTQF